MGEQIKGQLMNESRAGRETGVMLREKERQ